MPRPSPVTDAVRHLLETRERHVWALDELHEAVVARLGAADYSSVFRAASQLERERLVERVELGDGKARFEIRDRHHEHIRCESCGRVAEVPGCVLDDVAVQVQSATGFRVTSHQVVFGGLCADCAERREPTGR